MTPGRENMFTGEQVWAQIQSSPADKEVMAEMLPLRLSDEVQPPHGIHSALCYYTSAETAYKVLNNQALWARIPAMMNDPGEVAHGIRTINSALGMEGGQKFRRVLEELRPGVLERSLLTAAGLNGVLLRQVFMSCFCNHSLYDLDGRLSMWRAYGRGAGVALVFSGDLIPALSEHQFTTLPVRYWTDEQLSAHFSILAAQFEKRPGVVRAAHHFQTLLTSWAVIQALTLKNIAFREEEEFRTVRLPSATLTKRLTRKVEVLGGIPQIICELDMRHSATEKGVQPSLLSTLEHVIVGPCPYATEVGDALRLLLQRTGFGNAEDKVHIAKIPLRNF